MPATHRERGCRSLLYRWIYRHPKASSDDNFKGSRHECASAEQYSAQPASPHTRQRSWHPEEREHRSKEQFYWLVQNTVAPSALVLSLIAISFAGCSAWIALQGLEAPRSEQRPWIPVPVAKITGPLTFRDDKSAWISWGATVRNVGHSPAIDVRQSFHIEVIAKGNVFNAIPSQREECAKASRDAHSDQFRGRVVFPNDFSDAITGGGGVSDPQSYNAAWPGPHDLLFRVVGCIYYT